MPVHIHICCEAVICEACVTVSCDGIELSEDDSSKSVVGSRRLSGPPSIERES